MKWFLVGALLVSGIHQLTTTGRSAAPRLAAPNSLASDEEIDQLVAYAAHHPSQEIYFRVSKCYENRGELRRALFYLRQADKLEPRDLGFAGAGKVASTFPSAPFHTRSTLSCPPATTTFPSGVAVAEYI